MRMQKWVGVLVLITLGAYAQADDLQTKMPLDKVVFQLSAKQWVSTQSALLTVNINATLTNADLIKARAEIMANLAKIANGEWQLTQFERSQDSSGLEKLFVVAQARVLQANLSTVYQNAKGVSKPGATYEVNGIEFKPSLEEVQQVKSQLRERLYQQVKDELSRLNKIYSNQNYSVNSLIFVEGNGALPQLKAYQREMSTAVIAAAAVPPLSVSNELIMNAVVEAASNRKMDNTIANH